MPYSVDLRGRVIGAVDSGMHIDVAAHTFKVSRRVIYNWLDLRRATNSLEPKTGYQKGHSHKITDWKLFEEFAEANKKYTSPKLIIKWKELTGIEISENVILRALKKINFTSKKKLLAILKQTKRSVKYS